MDTNPLFLGQSFAEEFGAQPQVAMIAEAAAVVSQYVNYALGVDISSYCGPLTDGDFAAMYAGGVRWVLARASSGWQQVAGDPFDPANYVDQQFSNYCQSAYNNDLMFFGYHFPKFDVPQAGSASSDIGYLAFKYALKNKKAGVSFHGLEFDCEDQSNTNTNTKIYLNTLYGWFLHDPDVNTVPLAFYSSPGWFGLYPAVLDWVGPQVTANQKLVHLAQWIHPATPTTTITWQDLLNYYPGDAYKPQPPGWDDYLMVQWAENYIGMAGTHGHQIGLNLFHGDYPTMCQRFAYKPHSTQVPPVVVPPDVPPAEITLETLNNRLVTAEANIVQLQAEAKSFLGWTSTAPKGD
jgi:hypothetical protein